MAGSDNPTQYDELRASGGTEDHTNMQDYSSKGISDTVGGMKTYNAANYTKDMAGGLIDTGIYKRHQGAYPPATNPSHYGPDKSTQ